MKMNKTVAAVAAGMIAFGAFFSTSAAGIGYVDTNAALQSHPKMQKAQLDMRQAVQKAARDKQVDFVVSSGVVLYGGTDLTEAVKAAMK